MNAVVFSNARLIDPEAGTDSVGAVLVQNGRIAAVDKNGTESDQLFRTRNIQNRNVSQRSHEKGRLKPYQAPLAII